MNRLIKTIVALAAIFTALVPSFAKKQATHKVITANVRITGLEADEVPGLRWDDRKEICKNVILAGKPDLICLQEVIYDSWNYFKKEFKGYQGFGFEGPEMDPWTEGYHFIGKNCIFYKKSRYEFVSAGSYWLSEDPVIAGSISWNSARARHCNWLRLRDKKTGEEFRVISIHLDHISDEARQEQTKFFIKEAAQYQEDFPQILCGDFNSGRKNLPYQDLRAAGWIETWEQIHGEVEYGFTAHGFKADTKKKPGRRIDFIFTKGPVETLSSEVITDHPKGIYPSDHYFLISEVKFTK
jgi:endonuclease/exonuclease/phosphatase family metal-dependent hydrolase